jgi:GNAT superfamily N-acetyltransferase
VKRLIADMDDTFIREAKESDLPAIRKLMIELIEAVDDKEGFDIDTVSENCRTLLSDADSYILVAETNVSVIGVINFTVRKTLLHPGLSGLIDELVVTKSYRRKGVGKQLIYAAAEKCKQLGCCELEVSTEFTNTNAREFYKSCGFEEIGVLLEKGLPSIEAGENEKG